MLGLIYFLDLSLMDLGVVRWKMTGILSPPLDVSPRPPSRPAGAYALYGPGCVAFFAELLQGCWSRHWDDVNNARRTNDTRGHKKVGSGPGLLHHNRLGFSVIIVTSTLHSPVDGLTPRQILQIKTILFGFQSR